MRIDAGFDITVPPGWHVAGRNRDNVPGTLLVHAATVPLPRIRGDFGSGVLPTLDPDDVFVCLFEYDREAVGTALFQSKGVPRPRPSEFDPSAMQWVRPGMSGGQWFFNTSGRAWCLFAVLGSHARRQPGALKVGALLRGVRIR
ncbi:MAG: hypothetical protein JWM02_699 [Frankiales bacterium]|nr:hypothetical protein [Frankiales bacterium]